MVHGLDGVDILEFREALAVAGETLEVIWEAWSRIEHTPYRAAAAIGRPMPNISSTRPIGRPQP